MATVRCTSQRFGVLKSFWTFLCSCYSFCWYDSCCHVWACDPTCLLWILDVYRMLCLRIFWWDQVLRVFQLPVLVDLLGPSVSKRNDQHLYLWPLCHQQVVWMLVVLKAMMKSWQKGIGVLHDFVVVMIHWWKLWTIGILPCCILATKRGCEGEAKRWLFSCSPKRFTGSLWISHKFPIWTQSSLIHVAHRKPPHL